MLAKNLNKEELTNLYVELKQLLEVCLNDTLGQSLDDLLECQKRLIENKG